MQLIQMSAQRMKYICTHDPGGHADTGESRGERAKTCVDGGTTSDEQRPPGGLAQRCSCHIHTHCSLQTPGETTLHCSPVQRLNDHTGVVNPNHLLSRKLPNNKRNESLRSSERGEGWWIHRCLLRIDSDRTADFTTSSAAGLSVCR